MKTTLKSLFAMAAGGLTGLAPEIVSAQTAPSPIRLNIVVHDDVPENLRKRLPQTFLQPWINEIEPLTGRKVEFWIQENVAGITDIDYQAKGGEETLLKALRWHNDAFWGNMGGTGSTYRLDKTLVLVRNTVVADGNVYLGRAIINGATGWASTTAFGSVGHELGHMLNATHENAEVLFNGWFCETFMYPARLGLRSNCYRYSDINREAIRAYLSEAP